jgi:hypothetical protein
MQDTLLAERKHQDITAAKAAEASVVAAECLMQIE